TVINALLLRRLPVDRPSALMSLSRQDAETGLPSPLTFAEYVELSKRTSTFAGLLAHSGGDGSLKVGTDPSTSGEPIRVGRVSSNFFEVLGVRMALGHALVPVDDMAADPERSVVLSYDYWQRRFGADPAILGTSVMVFRNVPFTVIGVAARGFRGVEADHRTDVWWPVGSAKLMAADRLAGWEVSVIGRLRGGASMAQARADAQLVHA